MKKRLRTLGENAWWTFWGVTFPIILPGVVASFLLTFTISFDEFILAFFLAGTDATLPLAHLESAAIPRQTAISACTWSNYRYAIDGRNFRC